MITKNVGYDYGAFWRFLALLALSFLLIRKKRRPSTFAKNLQKNEK